MYCLPADVEVLSELFRDENDDYFTWAIKKATDFMDSRLSRRYVTPITAPIPGVIAVVCADLAGSYILDKYTGERSKEQTYYGDLLFKRAVNTMERIMDNGELDFNVPLSAGKGSSSYRPAVRSTNYGQKSLIDEALGRWNH
ncbi:DUF1320 family protein [Aneurinibacillus sp. Ricciae_BoGa-3]|uniref:phage protein Gp36 family protein n=1 Tax=Aneurinibacillus sp. Ricciae_BoGa-3 TaxID=3022697 RepID=UPI00234073CA|nr:phage protein Gp36 family protein [Aneurinibacillus sp. Ricciae_BoGa-3]WCK53842.1 DUF1320 family protein [Aneurinibacillus sp. Ricciae_BoGa-3]